MAAPIALREDYDALTLRGLARRSRCVDQARRLLALAEIYDGGSRGAAARIGDTGLQTVRDWVIRFNTNGPDGLVTGKASGKVPILDVPQRRALLGIVESGPIPAAHGVVRWRLMDLAQWLHDEFGTVISVQTLSRELRALGLRKLSARPRHYAQKPEEQDIFKKNFQPVWRPSKSKSRASR